MIRAVGYLVVRKTIAHTGTTIVEAIGMRSFYAQEV